MGLTGRIILIIVVILVVLQFIPAIPENSEEVEASSFVAVHEAPAEVESILKNSCYDCHSNTATWPWYAHVAPVSFWIGNHVEEGREHLNFSDWASYDTDRQQHKLEEIVEMVEEGEMPLQSYTRMHAEAELSPEQRDMLIRFVQKLRS